MVCILNRIPVFTVGKPGNSKSLALRILNQSLRGADSEDPFLRKYPQLYVISYQGSEVSTSEGITKVFEKAVAYKDSIGTDSQKALVLVHFDEIGLAEASPNNPLKVLHAHLEPGYPKDRPDYAVVGLSNFPLDAAKMNRGITLVRPPPHYEDLLDTAIAICGDHQVWRNDYLLNSLANAYLKYYQDLYHVGLNVHPSWLLDMHDTCWGRLPKHYSPVALVRSLYRRWKVNGFASFKFGENSFNVAASHTWPRSRKFLTFTVSAISTHWPRLLPRIGAGTGAAQKTHQSIY